MAARWTEKGWIIKRVKWRKKHNDYWLILLDTISWKTLDLRLVFDVLNIYAPIHFGVSNPENRKVIERKLYNKINNTFGLLPTQYGVRANIIYVYNQLSIIRYLIFNEKFKSSEEYNSKYIRVWYYEYSIKYKIRNPNSKQEHVLKLLWCRSFLLFTP